MKKITRISAIYASVVASYAVVAAIYDANQCLSIWRWGNLVCEVSEAYLIGIKKHVVGKAISGTALALTLL